MRDWFVTVCAECLQASCWHGEFMCDKAKHANTTVMTASALLTLGAEHPDHFSREKLRDVTGSLPEEAYTDD